MPVSQSVTEVESASACADLVRQAAADGLTVSVGHGEGAVVLSTRRLTRILEYEPGDLTVVVEAGLRLSELDRRLAAHGQRLSLDPPDDPLVGACLAANRSGPIRHRFGAPRDLVLGATVVLGDGTIASSGGKVVKNVAGYDLARLFCGSRGRLGVIVRAALRLHPRPTMAETLVAPVSSPRDAAAAWQSLQRSALVPSAVDILWPGRLAVLFEGSPDGVRAQVEAARGLLGGESADCEVWEESRARQTLAAGRVRFAAADLAALLADRTEAVVRPSAGVAYVPESVVEPDDPALTSVVDRLRAEFDPHEVFR